MPGMLLPRDVEETCRTAGLYDKPPRPHAERPRWHAHAGTCTRPAAEVAAALEELAGASPAVAAYLAYLREARAHFHRVKQTLAYWNETPTHSLGHDRWAVGWGGDALLPLADVLYMLHSHGVPGDFLEAGAFKGSSTACLSWVCERLGRRLLCADSFAGLPAGEGHYGTGDFRGPLDEVKANLEKCGVPAVVEFIEGWYRESLRGFDRPLMSLFMDVDLQESCLDVLRAVGPSLDPQAVLFSDGTVPENDLDGDQIRLTGSEPAGFHRYFAETGQRHRAVPSGTRGIILVFAGRAADAQPVYRADVLQALLERWGPAGS